VGADGVVVAGTTLDSIAKLAVAPEVTSGDLVSNFVANAVQLMSIMTRACGHDRFAKLGLSDLTTWLSQVALVSGVACSGQTHAT
jgi:hypothetical protein